MSASKRPARPTPIRAAAVAALCCAFASESPGGDEAVRARFGEARWSALERGEVVVAREPPEPDDAFRAERNTAAGILARPCERVWQVLTDFESWPAFLPNMRQLRILERDESRVRLRNQLRFFGLDFSHSVVYTLAPAQGRIGWETDPRADNDIERIEGSWQLTPLAGGERCLVEYAVRVDLGRLIPGFVEERLVRVSLPDVIRNLRDEVERRARTSHAS